MEKPTTSPPALEKLCIVHLLFNIANTIELLTSGFYWVCTLVTVDNLKIAILSTK